MAREALLLQSVPRYTVLGRLIRASLTNARASQPQDSPFRLRTLGVRNRQAAVQRAQAVLQLEHLLVCISFEKLCELPGSVLVVHILTSTTGTDTTTRASTASGANSSSSSTSITGYASTAQVPIGLASIFAMGSVLLL
jgi:hypothetical protein